MSAKWQRLCPANQSDLPSLLFKYHLTSDGYELYMTDLTNVWSEHLSRHQILTRADEKAATIDPSEDEEQYQMLLQKIGDAFHNEKDTHVTLDHDSRTDALELTTSTRLPRPLRPLEWTAYLEREPQSSLARYMLLPLIKAEADWESRQQNLMDQLKRKDWILGKLFDKLEAVGVDLSTIFPGVSGLRTGRKGATLSQAAKHIRGVAPFDEHGWLEEHKESTPDSNLAANLLAELFSKSEAVAQTNSFHLPPDSWWHGLSTASPTTLPRREDVGRTEEPKASRDDEMTDTASDTDAEDDDFERQETPPRLKRSKDTGVNPPDTRTSQTPQQEPSKTSPSPHPRKSLAETSTGLRKIGGPKAAPKQSARSSPSPGHEPPVSSQQRHTSPTHDDETDTGSDSDLDAISAPRRPTPQTQPFSPAKPRTLGLGRIGGKTQEQKQDTPESTPSRSPAPEDDDNNSQNQPQEKPPTKPTGLGTIGGKKTETPAPQTKSPDPQQDTDSSPSPPQPKPKPKPTGGKLGVIGGNKLSKHSASSATASQPPGRTASHANASADAETEDESDAPADEGPTSKSKLRCPAVRSPSPEESKHQPGPSEPRASQPPSEPETEEQKADRKREELKRQLQAKAKAPAKKKRKF